MDVIVGLLDGWNGPLTWDLLCAACERSIGTKPARQTLAKSHEIKIAFNVSKKRISKADSHLPVPGNLKMAAERIVRLEAEVRRLEESNQLLLQRFVVWQYNAYTFGMTDRELDSDLPAIDRDSTDVGG
jgi:hypothetical protein